MDTEKQRQRRRDDARLTESGNSRSEQLNTFGAYRVANQQTLTCLSGSERRRPGWFFRYEISDLFHESSVKIFTVQGQRGGRFLEQTLDLCRKLRQNMGVGGYLILGPFSRDYGISM